MPMIKVAEGPMCLLLVVLTALVLTLLLFPLAANRAAARTLRLAAPARGPFPVTVFPGAACVVLLLAGQALLQVSSAGELYAQLVLSLLPLLAAALVGYPILEKGIRLGYQRTTAGEIETARTLGLSEKKIKKRLLAGRSRGETIRALIRTFLRTLTELCIGETAAAVLLSSGPASVLQALLALALSIAFWAVLGGSLAVLLAAELLFFLTRRGRRRRHGT